MKNVIDTNITIIRTVEEKNCANYMELWDIDESNIMNSVKNVTF